MYIHVVHVYCENKNYTSWIACGNERRCLVFKTNAYYEILKQYKMKEFVVMQLSRYFIIKS